MLATNAGKIQSSFLHFAARQWNQKKLALKKLLAILILIAWVNGEYFRHADYFSCRVRVYLEPDANICDCEKLADDTNQSKDQLPATHAHLHLDEYCPLSTTNLTRNVLNMINTSFPPHTNELSMGYLSLTEKPPEF